MDATTEAGKPSVASDDDLRACRVLSDASGAAACMASTQTSLTIDDGAGANTLILDDQNNAIGSSWTVSGNDVTRLYGQKVGPVTQLTTFSVSYSNVSALTINGGKGEYLSKLWLLRAAWKVDGQPCLWSTDGRGGARKLC